MVVAASTAAREEALKVAAEGLELALIVASMATEQLNAEALRARTVAKVVTRVVAKAKDLELASIVVSMATEQLNARTVAKVVTRVVAKVAGRPVVVAAKALASHVASSAIEQPIASLARTMFGRGRAHLVIATHQEAMRIQTRSAPSF